MTESEKKYKSKLLYYAKIHLFGIEMIFLEFTDYNNIIENKFTEEKEKRQKAFDELYKKERPNDFASEYDDYSLKIFADDYWEIDRYFPHNYRASFLIQIFSFIEFELKEICNHHHLKHLTHFSVKDLKGDSDIDKVKLYLSKECKINFTELEPEWGFINLIRKIRNRLVHHQGIISKADRDWLMISNFVYKSHFIEFKEEKRLDENKEPSEEFTLLITGRGLNELLLENAKRFFEKLLEDKSFSALLTLS